MALVVIFAMPTSARATISSTKVWPSTVVGQRTVTWTSTSSGSSDICWDTTYHATYADFDAAQTSGTARCVVLTGNFGLKHSRTLRNLPAGTYWVAVRTGSETGDSVASFVVDSSTGGSYFGDIATDGSAITATAADTDPGHPDRAYIAGNFTRVGPKVGVGMALNASGASSSLAPLVGGTGAHVNAVTDDGSNGWYIGGRFDDVGGVPLADVAHILPDGGVDPTFDSRGGVGSGGEVYALDYDASPSFHRLYVGGRFTKWGNDSCTVACSLQNLIAVDDRGAILAGPDINALWGANQFKRNPGISGDASASAVRTILVDPAATSGCWAGIDCGFTGGSVYVGGDFTEVNGAHFSHVVRLSFLGDTGDFGMSKIADAGGDESQATVYSLTWAHTAAGGDKVIVAGSFATVGYTKHDDSLYSTSNFANLFFMNPAYGTRDPSTNDGSAMPTGPANGTNGVIHSVAFDPGSDAASERVYVGGDFDQVLGAGSTYDLAAFKYSNSASPMLGQWSAVAGFSKFASGSGSVNSLALDGSVLWAAGDFDSYDSTAAPRLIRLLAASGNMSATGYGQMLDGGAAVVGAPNNVGGVFIGGNFTMYNGQARTGLARLTVDADGTTAVDSTWTYTGGATLQGGSAGVVDALAVDSDNGQLYVGGDFDSLGGTSAHFLARVSTAGTPTVAAFNSEPDNVVHALAVVTTGVSTLRTQTLWVGGDLTGHLVKYANPSAGFLTTPSIVNGFNGTVYDLASDGSYVYAAGSFATSTTGGIARVDVNGFAADTSDFAAAAKTGGVVTALAVSKSGNTTTIYAGGPTDFQGSGNTLPHLLKFTVTGSTLTRDTTFSPPGVGPNGSLDQPEFAPNYDHYNVRDLLLLHNRLYVAGDFRHFGTTTDTHAYLAALSGTTGKLLTGFAPSASDMVTSLASVNDHVLVGGLFSSIAQRNGVGGLGLLDAPADTVGPHAEASVTVPDGSSAYALDSSTVVVPKTVPHDDDLTDATPSGSLISPVFTVNGIVHDVYALDAGDDWHVSGTALASISDPMTDWGGAGTWSAAGAADRASYARGLLMSCLDSEGGSVQVVPPTLVDSVDLVSNLDSIAHTGYPGYCSWRGRIVAPVAVSGAVTFSGTYRGGLRVKVGGAPLLAPSAWPATLGNTALGWSGSATVSASESQDVLIEWKGNPTLAGEGATLRWQLPHVDLASDAVAPPSAAFVGPDADAFGRSYSMVTSMSSGATGDERLVTVSGKDVDGNAAVDSKVAVKLDASPPSGDSISDQLQRAANGDIQSASFTVTAGSDVGAAGIKDRRIWVEYQPFGLNVLGIVSQCQTGSTTLKVRPVSGYLSTMTAGSNNVGVGGVYDFSEFKSGCYRFRLDTRDNVYNTEPSYADSGGWIKVDNVAPIAQILNTTLNTVGGVTNAIGVTSDTDSGLQRVYVTIDNGMDPPVNVCDTDDVTSPPGHEWDFVDGNRDGTPGDVDCAFDTSLYPDGSYVMIITSVDGAGHSQPSSPVTIIIDNHAPDVGAVVSGSITTSSYVDPSDATHVWINPHAAARFTVDVSTDDNHASDGSSIGVGSGIHDVNFGYGAGWSAPTAADNVMTSPNAAATGRFDNYVAGYVWDPSTMPVPTTARSVPIVVTDNAQPALTSTAGVNVSFDGDAPVPTLTYGDGEVADSWGYPHIAWSATDTVGGVQGSGVHGVELRTFDLEATHATVTSEPTCPAWDGDWSAAAVSTDSAPADEYDDTAVSEGHCYKYEIRAQDNVGTWSEWLAPHDVARTDEVAVTVARAAGGTVASVREADPDAPDVIQVQLQRAPAVGQSVRISLNADTGHTAQDGQVLLQTGSTQKVGSVTLTFTAKHMVQDVKVYAVDDSFDEADVHDARITLSSSDGEYAAWGPATYLVHVADDDQSAALQVVPITLNEGATAAQAVRVGLATTPFDTVRTTIDLGSNLVGTVDGSAPASKITADFTPANPTRTLLVTPVDDEVVQRLPVQMIHIAVDSSATADTQYRSVAFPDIPVTIIDDDKAQLTLGSDALKGGKLNLVEGADASDVTVTAAKASAGNVVIRPVVKPGANIVVSPTERTITKETPDLQVHFSVRAANDEIDQGDTYDGVIGWTVAPADASFDAKLADTPVVVTDDDATPPRTTRAAPATHQNPPPSGPRPKVTTHRPVPPRPRPIIQNVLPMASPSSDEAPRQHAPHKRAPKRGQSGLVGWASDHKGLAAGAAATAAVAGGAALAHGGMLAALKGLLGGLDHLLNGHHSLNPRNFSKKNRDRIRELARKRRRAKEEREPRERRRRVDGKRRKRDEDEDILDELEHKYDPVYDDPLATFERGPRGVHRDVLGDAEARLRGFDIDDAA